MHIKTMETKKIHLHLNFKFLNALSAFYNILEPTVLKLADLGETGT